jgi:hypothetical protein
MKIRLNGQEREARAGESILDLCRRENVPVPTFCYHQDLAGKGMSYVHGGSKGRGAEASAPGSSLHLSPQHPC